jgi:hypothetical protein
MTTTSLLSQLEQAGQVQAQLPAVTSLGVGLAAAALVASGAAARHLSVHAHEGAHALMSSGMGHEVQHVRIYWHGGGETKPDKDPGFLEAVVGYLGPSLFGLSAAELIRHGHIVAVLWCAIAGLILLFTQLKGLFSFVSVPLAAALIFVVARYASVGAQVAVAYGIAWVLLLGGIRVIVLRGADAQDAALLRALTRLPSGFWSKLWLSGSVLALAAGAILLI